MPGARAQEGFDGLNRQYLPVSTMLEIIKEIHHFDLPSLGKYEE